MPAPLRTERNLMQTVQRINIPSTPKRNRSIFSTVINFATSLLLPLSHSLSSSEINPLSSTPGTWSWLSSERGEGASLAPGAVGNRAPAQPGRHRLTNHRWFTSGTAAQFTSLYLTLVKMKRNCLQHLLKHTFNIIR